MKNFNITKFIIPVLPLILLSFFVCLITLLYTEVKERQDDVIIESVLCSREKNPLIANSEDNLFTKIQCSNKTHNVKLTIKNNLFDLLVINNQEQFVCGINKFDNIVSCKKE